MKRIVLCAALAVAAGFVVFGSAQGADVPAYLTNPAVATPDNEADVELAGWRRGYYGGGYYYGRPAYSYSYRPYYSYRPSYSYNYSYRPYYNPRPYAYNYAPYYYAPYGRPYVYNYGPMYGGAFTYGRPYYGF